MTGRRLIKDRYEAIEVVGRGGQGEVIRALDTLHGRHVALKIREISSEVERDSVPPRAAWSSV